MSKINIFIIKDFRVKIAIFLTLTFIFLFYNFTFGLFSHPIIPENLFSLLGSRVAKVTLTNQANCSTTITVGNTEKSQQCLNLPALNIINPIKIENGIYFDETTKDFYLSWNKQYLSLLTPNGSIFGGHLFLRLFYSTLGLVTGGYVLSLLLLLGFYFLLSMDKKTSPLFFIFISTSPYMLYIISTNPLIFLSIFIFFLAKNSKIVKHKYLRLFILFLSNIIHISAFFLLLWDLLIHRRKNILIYIGTILLVLIYLFINYKFLNFYNERWFIQNFWNWINLIGFEPYMLETVLNNGIAINHLHLLHLSKFILILIAAITELLERKHNSSEKFTIGIFLMVVLIPLLQPNLLTIVYGVLLYFLVLACAKRKTLLLLAIIIFGIERIDFYRDLNNRGLNVAVDLKFRTKIEQDSAKDKPRRISLLNDYGVSEWLSPNKPYPLYIDSLVQNQNINSLNQMIEIFPTGCLFLYSEYNYDILNPYWAVNVEDISDRYQVFNIKNYPDANVTKFCFSGFPN